MATAFHPSREPLIAIIGATGTGKSKLAVELAARFNGEVINADAMQMYKGLPIITNKIPVHERRSIPHHLLDTIDLASEPWTVTKFVAESHKVIREIRSRGKLPILVGGSHYYTQALLFKDSLLVCEVPNGSDSGVATIESEARVWPILSAPTAEIYAKLQEVDPAIAQRWHPNDRRHLQRSLEIYLQTGRKASELYTEQRQQQRGHQELIDAQESDNEGRSKIAGGTMDLRYETAILWLETENNVLERRLRERVDDMVNNGMIDEAVLLEQLERDQIANGKPPDIGKGIWISIGYRQLKPYIAAMQGSDTKISSELQSTGIEATKIATRQYARTQKRWIRIRLANALEEAGASGRLFLLDSTELEKWETSVAQPSQQIVGALLDGSPLPDPANMSTLAKELLPNASSSNPKRFVFEARTCNVCQKVLMTEKQWDGHLSSRRHRKARAGKSRRERDAAGAGRESDAQPA